MKTSNKILTTFLSIVAIYFLVFALDLRLLGEHRFDRKSTIFDSQKFEVREFSHIELDNVVIDIEASDKSYIQVEYLADTSSEHYTSPKKLQAFQPEYRGDTIRLSNHPGHYGSYKLFIKGDLPTVSATKSRFHLNKFEERQLSVDLNESTLGANNQCKIGTLNIKASNNSRINGYTHYEVDTLNVTLEGSNANFNKPIRQLSAKIDGKSHLNLSQVDDIRVKKEKGGKVYFR